MSRCLPLAIAASSLMLANCADAGRPAAGLEMPHGGLDGAADVAAPLDYAGQQKSTGLVVMRGERLLVDHTWPAPADPILAQFAHGNGDNGQPLKDVASLQKSVVGLLVAIAVDKGVIDLDQPVSRHLGIGWSGASVPQEAAIKVDDILTMSSGLDE